MGEGLRLRWEGWREFELDGEVLELGKNGHSFLPRSKRLAGFRLASPTTGAHPAPGAKRPGIEIRSWGIPSPTPRLPGRPDSGFLGGEWLLITHSLSPVSVGHLLGQRFCGGWRLVGIGVGWAGSWLGSWLEIQEQSLASRECSGRLGLAREKSTNARSWSGKLLEPEWDTPELVRQSGANPQKKVLGIDRVSDPAGRRRRT